MAHYLYVCLTLQHKHHIKSPNIFSNFVKTFTTTNGPENRRQVQDGPQNRQRVVRRDLHRERHEEWQGRGHQNGAEQDESATASH